MLVVSEQKRKAEGGVDGAEGGGGGGGTNVIKRQKVLSATGLWKLRMLKLAKQCLFDARIEMGPVDPELQRYICTSERGSKGPVTYFREFASNQNIPWDKLTRSQLEPVFLSFFVVNHEKQVFQHWHPAFNLIRQRAGHLVDQEMLQKAIRLLLHSVHYDVFLHHLTAKYPVVKTIPFQNSWLVELIEYGIRCFEQTVTWFGRRAHMCPLDSILVTALKVPMPQVDSWSMIRLILYGGGQKTELASVCPIVWSRALLDQFVAHEAIEPYYSAKYSAGKLTVWNMALCSNSIVFTPDDFLAFLKQQYFRNYDGYDDVATLFNQTFFALLDRMPDQLRIDSDYQKGMSRQRQRRRQ